MRGRAAPGTVVRVHRTPPTSRTPAAGVRVTGEHRSPAQRPAPAPRPAWWRGVRSEVLAYAAASAALVMAIIPALLLWRASQLQRAAAERALREKMLNAAQTLAGFMYARQGLHASILMAPVVNTQRRAASAPLRPADLHAALRDDFAGDARYGWFRVELPETTGAAAAREEVVGALATDSALRQVALPLIRQFRGIVGSFDRRRPALWVRGALVDGREVTHVGAAEYGPSGRPVALIGLTFARAPIDRAVVQEGVARLALLSDDFSGADWRTARMRPDTGDGGPTTMRARPTDARDNGLLLLDVTGQRGEPIYRTPARAPGDWDSPYAAEFVMGGEGAYEVHVRAVFPRALGDALVATVSGQSTQRWQLAGVSLLALGFFGAVIVEVRRQRQLAETRRAFVSAVSHELRTPVTYIATLTETLLMGGAESAEQERRWLSAIHREAHRIGHLAENVLLHARSARGPLPLEPAWTDMREVVDDVVSSADALAQARGVRVQRTLEGAPEAFVDPGAVRQILLNLVDNAIKYGPKGQTVLVTVTRASGDGALELAVRDEGPGVPPDARSRIWQAFERVGDRGGATGGSGLGLSVVRDLVAAHGGRAWVEDAPGGGARFVVRLPQPA